MDEDKVITLQLTKDQANAVSKGLEVFSRLCIGQIDEIENLVLMNLIPTKGKDLDLDDLECIRGCLSGIQSALGFQIGASHGISHSKVPIEGKRAYEVNVVLRQVLALDYDPNPKFPGVDYDGLIARVTEDPAPFAAIDTGNENSRNRVMAP